MVMLEEEKKDKKEENSFLYFALQLFRLLDGVNARAISHMRSQYTQSTRTCADSVR